MKKLILSTFSLLILVVSCSKDASTSTPTATPTNLGCNATSNGFTCKIDGAAFTADSSHYGWIPFNGARARIAIFGGGKERFAFYVNDTLIGTKTYALTQSSTRGNTDGYYTTAGGELQPYQSDSITITINSDKTLCGTFKTTSKNPATSNSSIITEGSFKGISVK
jgi:hypothetical protein